MEINSDNDVGKPVEKVYHNVAIYISLVLSAKVMSELQSLVYLSVSEGNDQPTNFITDAHLFCCLSGETKRIRGDCS